MQDHRPLLSLNSLSGILGNSSMQIHTWDAAHSLAPEGLPMIFASVFLFCHLLLRRRQHGSKSECGQCQQKGSSSKSWL